MAKMRHVNVVQFVGAATKPPDLLILTELLPRGSLYDVLRTGRMDWPLKVKVMHQAAAGLLYLHIRKPNMSIYLSIYVSISMSIYLSIYLSIYIYIYIYIYI